MTATNLEKLQRAAIILARGEGAVGERLALAYLFGLAWIYPDNAFAGYERDFDVLREEVAHVYYDDSARLNPERLAHLERRILMLSDVLLRRAAANDNDIDEKSTPLRKNGVESSY